MKRYRLNADQVTQQVEDILAYVGTPKGWGASHFNVRQLAEGWTLLWEPEAILRPTTWTARSKDIQRMIVKGFLSLQEAFRLHEAALQDGDMAAVKVTLEQLRQVTFTALAEAAARLRADTYSSAEQQRAGQGGGRPPHKREEICHDYDTWMSQGTLRPKVVSRLANKYDTVKDVINRILREEGRASRNTTEARGRKI